MTAATWWTPEQFDAVKQELAATHFCRSTLMRAKVKFGGHKARAKRRGIPFPPTFYDWWKIERHYAFEWRDELTAWRERQRSAPELTQEIVRELLDYDPATGSLTWRWRGRHWFESDRACNAWNARYAGQPAGYLANGYLPISLFNVKYKAHRLAFLWMEGRWPDPEVDHSNHDGTDNRWDNLFEVTGPQNLRNKTLYKNNKSGRVGVHCTDRGKYVAEIRVYGRTLYLGTFDTFEEACEAREAAEHKYGFHENHGKPHS